MLTLPRVVVITLLALLVPSGALAAAADPVAIADEVAVTGGFADAGASVDDAALDALAGDFARAGHRVGLVAVDTEPAGGATILAEAILEEVGVGIVLVRSPGEIGVASDDHDGDAIDRALDAAIDDLRSGVIPGFVSLGNELTGAGVTVDDGSPEAAGSGTDPVDDGSGRGWLLLLVVAGGVAALVWWSRRRRASAAERRLEEARAEIRAQLSVIADRMLALDDRVRLSDDPEVDRAFDAASITYRVAGDELAAATDHDALRDLADTVDHARWMLATVEARLDGLPIPPEPEERSAACFFDPDHPAATEDGTVRTAAGEQQVGVCADCAALLRAGERPEPRAIRVGGDPLPAPAAPREHGGGGLGWLGPAMEILVSGMATGATYEMGRAPRRRSIPTPPSWGGGRSARRRRSGGATGRSSGGTSSRSERGTERRAGRVTKGRGGRRL